MTTEAKKEAATETKTPQAPEVGTDGFSFAGLNADKLQQLAKSRSKFRGNGAATAKEQSSDESKEEKGQGQGLLSGKPDAKSEAPAGESKAADEAEQPGEGEAGEDDPASEGEKTLTAQQRREFRKLKKAATAEAREELSAWTAKVRRRESELGDLEAKANKIVQRANELEELKKTNPLKWFEEQGFDPRSLAEKVIESEEAEDPKDRKIRLLEERLSKIEKGGEKDDDDEAEEEEEPARGYTKAQLKVIKDLRGLYDQTSEEDYPFLHAYHAPEEVSQVAFARVAQFFIKHNRNPNGSELAEIWAELDDEAEELQEKRAAAKGRKEKKRGSDGREGEASKASRGGSNGRGESPKALRGESDADQTEHATLTNRASASAGDGAKDIGRNKRRALAKIRAAGGIR